MGFFSEIDIAISEMIADGATRKQVRDAYPMLRDDEIDSYFDNEHDGDYEAIARDEYDDSMDGDAQSALASAGFGTDEDYGFFGENEHYEENY